MKKDFYEKKFKDVPDYRSLFSKFCDFITDDEIEKAEEIMSLISNQCIGKPNEHNMGGYTVGCFKQFLRQLAINENIPNSLSNSFKREEIDKIETYIRNSEVGEVINFYTLSDWLKFNSDDKKTFKKVISKLKKESYKFGSMDYGNVIWLISKPVESKNEKNN